MDATHYVKTSKEAFLPTPNEGWSKEPYADLWYTAAAQFAISALGKGYGRKCLVIGSPGYEVSALQYHGWEVDYLDIRVPPFAVNHIQGDVTAMPFADESFDAVSSTCVLCHAGLGRYGDPIVVDGDMTAIKEIARVMKQNATAAIMFGPCIPSLKITFTYGIVHRIYSLWACSELAKSAGLLPVLQGLWRDRWLTPEEIEISCHETGKESDEVAYCYQSMKLKKEKC